MKTDTYSSPLIEVLLLDSDSHTAQYKVCRSIESALRFAQQAVTLDFALDNDYTEPFAQAVVTVNGDPQICFTCGEPVEPNVSEERA